MKLVHNSTAALRQVVYLQELPNGKETGKRVNFNPGINQVTDEEFEILQNNSYFQKLLDLKILSCNKADIKQGVELTEQAHEELGIGDENFDPDVVTEKKAVRAKAKAKAKPERKAAAKK